jgi:hypothetical protein
LIRFFATGLAAFALVGWGGGEQKPEEAIKEQQRKMYEALRDDVEVRLARDGDGVARPTGSVGRRAFFV